MSDPERQENTEPRERKTLMDWSRDSESMTVGSVLWGVSEERASLEKALLGSGLGIAACLLLNLPFPLPEPSTTRPVLVTNKYKIDPDRAQEFLEAIHKYQRIRRRDDATLGPNTSGHTIA